VFSPDRWRFIVGEIDTYFIFAVSALGINTTFGMAGIMDFGYITFVAVGAYFGAVVALGPAHVAQQLDYILGWHLPWPVPILAGAVAAALLACTIGLVAYRRLEGEYQAIVMVALWSIAFDVVIHTGWLFNGEIGVYNVPQPLGGRVNPADYVWVFLPITGVVFLLVVSTALFLERSAFARTLRAVRDDPHLAESCGKELVRIRLKAGAVGALFAGVAGALYVEFLSAWNTSAWGVFEVVLIIAAVVIGGRGRVVGVLLGAAVVRAIIAGGTFLPNVGSRPDLTADLRQFVLAAVLLLALLLRPQGILGERSGLRVPGRRSAGASAHSPRKTSR
jgi:branched-chain amino acid transport system permease protein